MDREKERTVGGVGVVEEVEKPCAKVAFYDIYKTIGRGNFAVVKLARHRFTKSEVAMKIIDKRELDESNLTKVYREVDILKRLDHEHIIRLYQVMESENMLYIVSEYASQGEMFDYIARHGRMSEIEARQRFWQIIRAVDYCHQNGIVHRDLKTENLLLDADMNIKIADFGFGNFYKPGEELSTWCGSPPYAAPEVFEGKKYGGTEIDIWSLGVILYILVCGALPFDASTLPALRDRVVSGRFRIPYFMSTDCENLLRRMLVVDPRRRATMEQIKNHAWMSCDIIPRTISTDISSSGSVTPTITSSSHSPTPVPSPAKPPLISDGVPTVVYNDKVLRIMKEQGIDIDKTIKALDNKSYDHLAAIYYLLVDKVKQQLELLANKRLLLESGCRRPSTIADQASLCVGQRAPALADTRQGVFSQTTDGVSVQDPVGAILQLQQRIYTDAAQAGLKLQQYNRALLRPVNVMKLKGGPSKVITMSIDEGVEVDSSSAEKIAECTENAEGENKLGQRVNSAHGGPLAIGQISRTTPYYNTSTDSNIELDIASNLSSSFGSLVSGDENETGVIQPEESVTLTQSTETTDDSQHEHFSEGRRASDGLAAHGISAFHAQFKVVRSHGLSELRKELERLKIETSGKEGHADSKRFQYIRSGKFRHTSGSEDSGSASPQRSGVYKRKPMQGVSSSPAHEKRYMYKHSVEHPVELGLASQDVLTTSQYLIHPAPLVFHNISMPIQRVAGDLVTGPRLVPLVLSSERLPHLSSLSLSQHGAWHKDMPGGQQGAWHKDMPGCQHGAWHKDVPGCQQGAWHKDMPGCRMEACHKNLSTCLPSHYFSGHPGSGVSGDNVPTCRSHESLVNVAMTRQQPTSLLETCLTRNKGGVDVRGVGCHDVGGVTHVDMGESERDDSAPRRHMVRRTLFKMAQQVSTYEDPPPPIGLTDRTSGNTMELE